jgi:proton-dependent oligopeptide transporter, POT family
MPGESDRAFLGHPKGLANLFFTEMWERFSYYGMRAFLIFYIGSPESVGGLGYFDVVKNERLPIAGAIVGMFGASVYLLGLPGGWIADRFLGQRKAVTIGGLGIAIGNGILAIPGTGNGVFYVGLVLIAIGTGFLKPNISTLVGQLYGENDPRRDSGYTIYYMGINIGAFFAPLVCGYLAQNPSFRKTLFEAGIDPNYCWNFAFGAAALGMIGGLIQYTIWNKWLGDSGLKPTIPDDPARAERDRTVLKIIIGALVVIGVLVVVTKPSAAFVNEAMGIGLIIGSVLLFVGLYKAARDARERRGIIAMLPLYLGAISFFAIFEQAPTTLNIFAEDLTRREVFGIYVPASMYQSVNAIFIVLLAPVFAIIWVWLARRKKEPTSVSKFAIGMVLLAVSFVVMIPHSAEKNSNSFMYLVGLYFFYTLAELCISPVGLSSMSKLAPKRLAGMVMGMWFFGTAIGIYLAGRATSISSGRGFNFLFTFLLIASLVVAIALFVVSPMIKRMMGADAKTTGPADKSAKAEPEPLPSARVVKDKDD